MGLSDFKTIFAKGQPSSRPHHAKKTVSFNPSTIFESGPALYQWQRKSPAYLAGKHSCPPDLGDWLDTSLMGNDLEQLLNLKVHAVFHVRDAEEIDALHDSFHAHMQAGLPFLPGLGIPLRDHPLCDEVLNIYEDLTASGDSFSSLTGDDWRQAKVLVLYEDQSEKSITLQFINDTGEDLEAHEYILELRRSVPPENVGTPRTDTLRKLRDDWLAEVCGANTQLQ